MIHKIVPALHWTTNQHKPDPQTAQAKLDAITQQTYRVINPCYVWEKDGGGGGIGGPPPKSIHVVYTQGTRQDCLILEKIIVDGQLEQLRRDFEARITAMEKQHQQKLEAIFEAVRGASQDALREASLRLLEDVVTSGMVEKLPERLSQLIDQSVTAALQRASDNA